MLRAVLLLLGSVLVLAADPVFSDIEGAPHNPFRSNSAVRVFLFVRTDCPITNRYAPELQRIADEYRNNSVQFWLIYADRSETVANVRQQLSQYRFPGHALFDPHHLLVQRAQALVAPEAAVFDSGGKLLYHGRIDNRWVDVGKARPSATVHDLENVIAAALHGHPVKPAETRAIGCALADIE
jgi:thiol-disulfide isomerase/thioredoxin